MKKQAPKYYKHTNAMIESIKRVREVYPENHAFVTAGSIGNYPSYPKDLEKK